MQVNRSYPEEAGSGVRIAELGGVYPRFLSDMDSEPFKIAVRTVQAR